MRKFAIVLLLTLSAGAAQAGIICDVQSGLVPEGDYVEVVCAVVTAVHTYGCSVAESPFGPCNYIWVYLGSGHTAVVGDIVNIGGYYEEYYDLSEINVGAHAAADPASYFDVVGTCDELPAPIVVTATEILADSELYESCNVLISDGFIITEAPTSYGEWFAMSHEDPAAIVMFDDYWFDVSGVEVGQCYNNATGMWTYNFSAFKLEVFADGFPPVECSVGTQETTLGSIKALYR